jgi:hypothetical protein
MKSFLHDHPSEEIKAALGKLLDALCSWERDTGRNSCLVLREDGFVVRAVDGKPCRLEGGFLEEMSDGALLAPYERESRPRPTQQRSRTKNEA